jgi:hypothetical protein
MLLWKKQLLKLKRTPYIDEKTGEYNLKYNMQNMLEDFYIPIRGNDSTTKIDNLAGLQWDGIADVEYLRDKLFAALKVPKAFMGYDENTDGKATLAAQDIRFARTVERIQRIFTSELYKIALIHLYTQGYRDGDLTNFEISLTTPSIIYEQEKIALMTEKVTLAQSMLDSKLIPSDWIYENIFHFSQDQYEEYRDLINEDTKRQFRLSQIEAEGNDPSSSGKSYGTPHDLASLYGKGRMYDDPSNLPDGYDENTTDKKTLERPVENPTNRDKQEGNFGKDRLGRKGMKKDYNDTSKNLSEQDSNRILAKYESMLKDIPIDKNILLSEDKVQRKIKGNIIGGDSNKS